MKTLSKLRLVVLLLGSLAVAAGYAQDSEESPPTKSIDLRSLDPTWWSDFEQSGDAPKSRADVFLSDIGVQLADLHTPNQDVGQSILDAVSDNISAYLALLEEPEVKSQQLPEPALGYSIDELLDLAAEARDAGAEADRERLEVEREQRILAGASRRRDLAFKGYTGAAAGDERLLAALRLIQNRSAQAISDRRLLLLTDRYERSAAYAEARAARVDYAADKLTTTPAEAGLFKLIKKVEEREAAVSKSHELLRAAELAATGLDLDTAKGRSQQQLQQQKQVDAEVSLALAEVALAEVQARRWWTAMELAAAPDLGALARRRSRMVDADAAH